MNLFKIFCLILIYVSISYGGENKDLNTDLEAINKWTEVGVEFAKAVQTENAEQCISAVLSLATAVPYLGPIASALSAIVSLFGGPDSTAIALKQIQDTLNVMNSKLFAIERKILDVVDEVQDQIIINEYKKHVDSVFLLQASYKRAVEEPTPSTKTDLVNKCNSQQFNMLNLINWVHKDIVTESIQPITTVMTREYDLSKFLKWSKSITSIFAQAIVLHTVCIGAISKNATDISKTLGYDSKVFGQQSKDIANTLKVSLNKLKTKFFEHAKTEVDAFLADNAALDHNAFSDGLFSKLSNKYRFRHWIVHSYSGSTANEKHASITRSNSYHWKGIHGRSLFVSSTNSNSVTFQTEVELNSFNCLHEYHFTKPEYSAIHLLEYFRACQWQWVYESILVIPYDGKGFRSGTGFGYSKSGLFYVLIVKSDDH